MTNCRSMAGLSRRHDFRTSTNSHLHQSVWRTRRSSQRSAIRSGSSAATIWRIDHVWSSYRTLQRVGRRTVGGSVPATFASAMNCCRGMAELLLSGAVDRRPFVGTVYNLSVVDLECYAVGRDNVLVHNTGDSGPGNKAPVKEGRYEFPDQQAEGNPPYVGQSGNVPERLAQHESAGRLTPGTESTTEVLGENGERDCRAQSNSRTHGWAKGRELPSGFKPT